MSDQEQSRASDVCLDSARNASRRCNAWGERSKAPNCERKKEEKAQVNKQKFPTILAGSIDQRPCIYSIIKKGKFLCVEAKGGGQAWSGAGVDAMIKKWRGEDTAASDWAGNNGGARRVREADRLPGSVSPRLFQL